VNGIRRMMHLKNKTKWNVIRLIGFKLILLEGVWPDGDKKKQ
jgi:hypothetical protein